MAISGCSSSKRNAGRGMMKHLPKFVLVRSWNKFFKLLIIYGVNVAAFVAGLAKAADDVDETHKEFWANIQAFLMTLSYVLSAANCLHEPNEKERAWNVFKFLMLVALFLVDVYLVQLTYSKKGKDISAEDKEHYASIQLVLFLSSSLLSAVSSHVKLLQNEGEPAACTRWP
ncbi:uncharacterized protein LOC131326866 [Rhododendron vialii]|uniref:uncharacterized protein LOC131326866 n=1 Tax=Rhododendron vialii TaxID=182163 RepID=UPI00265F8F11|nr:uncharacterized protein LOC131326866 [Rhododendron vialii]